MSSGVLRVQLLGPVRAWRDGEPVPVRGGIGRSVLARLAPEPGRFVSIGELMDRQRLVSVRQAACCQPCGLGC